MEFIVPSMEFIVPASDLYMIPTGMASQDIFLGPARLPPGATYHVLATLNTPPRDGNVRVEVRHGDDSMGGAFFLFIPTDDPVTSRLLYTSGSGWSSSVGDSPLFEVGAHEKNANHVIFIFSCSSSPVVKVTGYNGRSTYHLVPSTSGWQKATI